MLLPGLYCAAAHAGCGATRVQVPMPVVTMEPPIVNYEAMLTRGGLDINVTNHGLVQTDHVLFETPANDAVGVRGCAHSAFSQSQITCMVDHPLIA